MWEKHGCVHPNGIHLDVCIQNGILTIAHRSVWSWSCSRGWRVQMREDVGWVVQGQTLEGFVGYVKDFTFFHGQWGVGKPLLLKE